MSTNRVDVGTPPSAVGGWNKTEVCFHGFANLPTTRGEHVRSPEFSCFGHEWVLFIYPGGHEDSDEGYVAINLGNMSNTSIKVQFGYSVRDADDKEVVYKKKEMHKFNVFPQNNAKRTANFVKRSKLLQSLVDGSLVIEVRMKSTSTDKSITQFIPSNPINKNVLKLFMNEETADVVFEVGGRQQTKGTRRKRAKTSTTNFHAHRPILLNCAPTLHEMCGTSDGGITTVSITDVKPETFKHMIHYAYGGKLSEEDLKANAKDIINACDKYGVVHLKLEAEAFMLNQ